MSSPVVRQVSCVTFCWTIERRDGAGLALTSHDQSLLRGQTCFRSDPGVSPCAVHRGQTREIAEVTGVLDDRGIRKEDVINGRWDSAKVSLEAVDWEAPEIALSKVAVGELGRITGHGINFSADLIGTQARLGEWIVPTTSPECRSELGDRACRVNLAARRRRMTAIATSQNILTLDQAPGPDFKNGILRWLRGPNTGLSATIVRTDGVRVWIAGTPEFEATTSLEVLLTEGCDKRLETCSSRFENALNFRGEPHLPGNDLLTRYPGT